MEDASYHSRCSGKIPVNQNTEPYCPFELPQILLVDFVRFLLPCLEIVVSGDGWHLSNNITLVLPPPSRNMNSVG